VLPAVAVILFYPLKPYFPYLIYSSSRKKFLRQRGFSPGLMVIHQKYRIALDFHQGPAGASIATQPAAK
jgi:hypothetical protein